jgi:hypothetical protein
MAIALFLFAIPLAWIVFAKLYFHHKYSWKEAQIQFGISVVSTIFLTALTYIALHNQATDIEILNGQVTNKFSQRVSCVHSYECNCTTRTDSDGNSQRVCQTCYEHPFDVNWVVETTVGNVNVSRVDRQGRREPPRFSKVVIGEPASRENTYQNYVKANPDSIFNTSDFAHLMEGNNYELPNYPRVHDYYRVNRVLVTEPSLPRSLHRQLSQGISMELRTLGHEKEVNVILVVTGEESSEYARALEYKWLGGNKNDLVIVMGISDYPKVNWVESFGWSSTNRIYFAIEDEFQGVELDVETFPTQLSGLIREHYNRQSFKEFEYLMSELSPPVWSLILAFILNLVIAIIVGRYFLKNDI